MKDDGLYLHHIRECIARIEQYCQEGKAAFLSDTKTQDAVLRNLQVLAESTQCLSAPMKQSHTEIDWRAIAGFRNILVHHYLGVNITRVWEIVERHVPDLKQAIEEMLKQTE